MVSFEADEYINDYRMWNAAWHVTLNNGVEVFDDNGRRDEHGNLTIDSWYRLKEYCDSNGLWIEKLLFRFRSHVEHIDPCDDGYFLKRAILSSPGNKAIGFFVIGNIKDGKIYTTKWRTPELIPDETDVRIFAGNEGVSILKKVQ